jgi:hypothetical protein
MREAATTIRAIDSLRARLNITNRELGLILGQSREVVESWFNGADPDDLDATRIAQVDQALQALVAAGVPVSAKTLSRKATGGASILSAISRGDNLQAVIDRLIPTLTREADQAERLNRQTAGRRPAFEPGDFGAPAWAEESTLDSQVSRPPSSSPVLQVGEGRFVQKPLLFLQQDPEDVRRIADARAAVSALTVLLIDVDNVGKSPSLAATRELLYGQKQRHAGRPALVKIAGKTLTAKSFASWWLQLLRAGVRLEEIEMRLVLPGPDAADDALVSMLQDVHTQSPNASLYVNARTNDQALRRRIRAVAVESGGRLEPLRKSKF